MSTNLPSFITQTLPSSASGTVTFDMRGIDRASVQIHTTLTAAATDVLTLKVSNDNVHFVGFGTAKTVTFTGGTTDDALFELGPIDYAYLQLSFAAPSAGNVVAACILYATATIVTENT